MLLILGNFLLLWLFASEYYFIYFIFLAVFFLIFSFKKVRPFVIFINIFVVVSILLWLPYLDDALYDVKIRLDLENYFISFDTFTLVLLSLLQLLLTISTRFVNFKTISKNLGYNAMN